MQSEAAESLVDFAASVRGDFLRKLEGFPAPIRRVVKQGLEARRSRVKSGALIGEYAPRILADMLPLRSPNDVIQAISPALMDIYVYVLLTDDLVDGETTANAGLLTMACGLLLERGLTHLFGLVRDVEKARATLDAYAIELASATIEELERGRARLRSFSEAEVSQLGKKGAPLKMLAALMMMVEGEEDLPPQIEAEIEHLSTGLQLLDDLTDWREDWEIANYTFPLCRTVNGVIAISSDLKDTWRSLQPQTVFALMILTGAIEETLSRGLTSIRHVQSSPHLRAPSTASTWLDHISRNCVLSKRSVSVARRALEPIVGSLQSEVGGDWIVGLTQHPVATGWIEHVERRLEMVAQDS